MTGEAWTQTDVAVLAAEYFAVLDAERDGRPVNKNDALRRAQAAMLTDRTIHTLKDRCYRISEELWKRGLPWVDGWKPPTMVGQRANSVNVAATIWAAIEPMVRRIRGDDFALPLPEKAPNASTQSYLPDAELRQAIEEVAHLRLIAHFVKLGWVVEDTHLTSPYDAKATKGGLIRYLEAKGTQSHGHSVFVTRGEVEWANNHVGQCVMGIVSGIRLDGSGRVDPSSGTLHIVDWMPSDGDLVALQYRWTPPQDDLPSVPPTAGA